MLRHDDGAKQFKGVQLTDGRWQESIVVDPGGDVKPFGHDVHVAEPATP